MSAAWPVSRTFYHLFPLGALGAPSQNEFSSPPSDRLSQLDHWLDHWLDLGVGAVLLGPIFESSAHGYDTADYFQLDRRLGDHDTFAACSEKLHHRGLKLVFDGVFHHVGRDFWAFQDVQQHGAASAYCDWFHLDFSRTSPNQDPFWYEGWNGHFDLVKLNLNHPAVREHLLQAVSFWIEEFDIDGLRLDAADVLDLAFQRELALHCRAIKPDFWLMGEVIHGDYRQWANTDTLDATTNYEVFKGLYSSHKDRNYFEIAHSLQRLFGEQGLYAGLHLYNFVDNHDQPRIASQLSDEAQLYPLHLLLFTVPGIPSLYYGSEIALTGRKTPTSDSPLRPPLTPETLQAAYHPLQSVIRTLIRLRRDTPALQRGDYRQLHVNHQQLAFQRSNAEQQIVVVVNSAHESTNISLPLTGRWRDLLNTGVTLSAKQGQLKVPLDPCWGRILERLEG